MARIVMATGLVAAVIDVRARRHDLRSVLSTDPAYVRGLAASLQSTRIGREHPASHKSRAMASERGFARSLIAGA